MGKLFGTDGIRGIVGENLTVELAFHVGQAVAAVLTGGGEGASPPLPSGKDTRISSDMLEAALMAGICSVGGDVMPPWHHSHTGGGVSDGAGAGGCGHRHLGIPQPL